MKYQLHWFSKMEPIRDHYFGVVLLHRDDDRLTIKKGIYFFTVDNCPDPQETKEYLVLSCDDDMVG